MDTVYTQANAQPLIERAQRQGRVRVIVGLRQDFRTETELSVAGAAMQRSRVAAAQQTVLAGLGAGGREVARFQTIPYLALDADPAALQRLMAAPGIASIQEDVPVPPLLAQSVPLIRADRAAALGFTGKGWTVAVLDTGAAKAHPMLKGKFAAEACYSSTVRGEAVSLCPGGAAGSTAAGSGANCPNAISGCEHGTHVSTIAVGSSASLKGVARDAKLISIKIYSRFDRAADCFPGPTPCVLAYTSDIIKGLERVYALRNSFKIAAANLSLGGGLYANACDAGERATKAIIDNLRSAKIATVVAAGNEGAAAKVSYPACISSAVAVASTTKADQLSSFSNWGTLVDLAAPGSNILAGVPATGYAALSGTSMAAPHVAGAWAILRQGEPAASVATIQSYLTTCSGVPVTRKGVTRKRIDVLAALNIARTPASGCK